MPSIREGKVEILTFVLGNILYIRWSILHLIMDSRIPRNTFKYVWLSYLISFVSVHLLPRFTLLVTYLSLLCHIKFTDLIQLPTYHLHINWKGIAQCKVLLLFVSKEDSYLSPVAKLGKTERRKKLYLPRVSNQHITVIS